MKLNSMKLPMLGLTFISVGLFTFSSCSSSDSDSSTDSDTDDVDDSVSIDVDPAYFYTEGETLTITKVSCTLSDGSSSECYQIVTTSVPADHTMGPWCPDNIEDDAEAGGIWLEDGEVYDVDGAFVKNMATFYDDDKWLMYDENGDVYITETEEDCINAANPDVGTEYENFCVECIPDYITSVSQTWLIPVTPVYQSTATYFNSAGGAQSNVPTTRGVALNGIEFSAPAPTSNILSAYTLAPFDDAGGHINVHQGYHYHAATGYSTSVDQEDGHAALIGYALDGYGIYELLDVDGNTPTDLDDLLGHSDDTRGYHYHVDEAGNNNFINGLRGAYVL
ncbi:YHYH protein [uncultured Formosa sp.]|uniref:YHYH protein n=1 Tax=uncultured Formosa sp. TaxID=255435 RepID=UPI00262303CB|nr:YHYH protein [uncultured Formosa sp.]